MLIGMLAVLSRRSHICRSLIAFTVLSGLCAQAEEASPLLAGFHADPTVCRVGGDYYASFSSFAWYPGLPIYHSRDLRHWQLVSHVLTGEKWRKILTHLPHENSSGAFAPTLRHHGGRFYLVCNINQICQVLAVAERAEGPWTVREMKRSGADPSIVFDVDGTCWEHHLVVPKEVLWKADYVSAIQKYDVESASPIGERVEFPHSVVRGQVWSEGAHVYRLDGRYLLLQAEGGTGFSHSETAMWSKKVEGPYWPQANNPVLTFRHRGPNSYVQGAGHVDLVDTPEGKLYALFHAQRYIPDGKGGLLQPLGRECFMCPAEIAGGSLYCYGDRLVSGTFADFPGDYYETVVPGVRLKRPSALDFVEDREIATSRDGAGAALVFWRTSKAFFALCKQPDEIVLEESLNGATNVAGRIRYDRDAAILRLKVDHHEVRFFAGAAPDSLVPVGGVRDIRLVCERSDNKFITPGVGTFRPSARACEGR